MKIRQSKTILLMSLLTLLLPLALAQLATAQQTSSALYVDPSTYHASEQGEVFTIDVNIANIPDLMGFEFKLGYNTTLIDATDVVIGPFPQPISWATTEINEPEGYVWVVAICMQAVEGNGTLATITFNATYTESGSCTLDLYDTKLYDSNPASVTHDVEDGYYSVVPEFPATIVVPLLLIVTLAAAFLGKMVWSRKR